MQGVQVPLIFGTDFKGTEMQEDEARGFPLEWERCFLSFPFSLRSVGVGIGGC